MNGAMLMVNVDRRPDRVDNELRGLKVSAVYARSAGVTRTA